MRWFVKTVEILEREDEEKKLFAINNVNGDNMEPERDFYVAD